ncbi:MAG: FxLYD domain-containing protein [Caldilineaceae bacterium]|nr:FxLYD domain-containing protein [Caldilineaceae bacterium]
MRRYFRFCVLLIIGLLAAGCMLPAQVQPAGGPVVQGSTAAPTEPAPTDTPVSVGIVEVPAETPTDTPLPPVETATSLPPVASTPAPSATPTVAPTTAPPATPTPAPTAPPTPAATKTPYPTGIFVASHRGFSDGSNYVVVGEVLNTSGVAVYGVKVITNFYDSGGKLVAAGQTLTSLAMTEPEVGNPFKLKVENLASAVDRYELTVTWEDVSLIEFRYLTVVEGAVGQVEVTGQIRNEQESVLTSIVVAVTFYDAAGGVVDTADIFLGGQTLAPGASMPFAIPLGGGDRVYDHFWIEAQGNLNLF